MEESTMTVEFAQALYVDDRGSVTFAQLVQRSGLTESEISELVECGAITGAQTSAEPFSERCVVVARTARRLRDEFALDDSHALALVLRLTQRIEALEAELRRRRRGD
jgi:chaperone modulatory protein CbpM